MPAGRKEFLSVALFLALAPPAALAQTASLPAAETLGSYFGSSDENRIVLAFKASDDAVQKLLPAGWTVAPIAQGPAQGANVSIAFVERLATFDAGGKPAGGEEATVILVIPARKDSETALAVVAAFSDPRTAPDFFYKTGKPATVGLERRLDATNLNATVQEAWTVAAEGGERIDLRVGYDHSQPARMQFDARNVSAADDRVRRTYRVDQGSVVLKSAPGGVDRTRSLSFSASGGVLAALFDGSERMVSAVSLPWYRREMYLPATQ